MAVDVIGVVDCFLFVVLVCVVVIVVLVLAVVVVLGFSVVVDIVSEVLDVVVLVAVDFDELAVDGVGVDIFLAVSKLRLGELWFNIICFTVSIVVAEVSPRKRFCIKYRICAKNVVGFILIVPHGGVPAIICIESCNLTFSCSVFCRFS